MPKKSRKVSKAMTLDEVCAAVSETLQMLRHYILKPHEEGREADIPELKNLAHAMFQGASVYKSLMESSALEELDEIREAIAEIRESSSQTQIRA